MTVLQLVAAILSAAMLWSLAGAMGAAASRIFTFQQIVGLLALWYVIWYFAGRAK